MVQAATEGGEGGQWGRVRGVVPSVIECSRSSTSACKYLTVVLTGEREVGVMTRGRAS